MLFIAPLPSPFPANPRKFRNRRTRRRGRVVGGGGWWLQLLENHEVYNFLASVTSYSSSEVNKSICHYKYFI